MKPRITDPQEQGRGNACFTPMGAGS